MAAYFLARSLDKLRDEINVRWTQRDKASDGWIGDTSHQARPSDHNPDRSAAARARGVEGIVRALDTDEDLDGNRVDSGWDAWPVVEQIIANRDHRVAYVIYEGWIWRSYDRPGIPAWTPARYDGVNPHGKHAHVSIRHAADAENDTSPWLAPKQAGGPITKDWSDMATKEELAEVVEAAVKPLMPWLGQVYGDPSGAVFAFGPGLMRVWIDSWEAVAVADGFFEGLQTNNGKPYTPTPEQARGYYLVNQAELEAHLGHPYTY